MSIYEPDSDSGDDERLLLDEARLLPRTPRVKRGVGGWPNCTVMVGFAGAEDVAESAEAWMIEHSSFSGRFHFGFRVAERGRMCWT